MNELKTYIDLKTISDAEITAKGITKENLWMLKDEHERILGPFDTQSLKDYSHKFDYLFETAEVFNLKDEQWTEFYTLTQFQRRKPRLVPAQNLIKSEEFYVKTKNDVLGPLSEEDVQALLDKGHVLSSDKLSVDGKNSWIKIFDYHSFDRRTITNKATNKKSKATPQELPHSPTDEVFQLQDSEVYQQAEATSEDIIAGLAFLSHGKDTGIIIEDQETRKIKISDTKEDKKVMKEKGPSFFSQYKINILTGAFSFMLALFVMNHFLTNEQAPEFTDVAVPTKGIDNSQRTKKKLSGTKRSPASVKPGKKTKENRASLAKKRKRIKLNLKRNKKTNIREKADRSRINTDDPEVVEELTRDFAGGYDDLDGNSDLEPPEDAMELNDDYDSEDEFDPEQRIDHESYDY